MATAVEPRVGLKAASMAGEMAMRRADQMVVNWVPVVVDWAWRMILTWFSSRVGCIPAGTPAKKSGLKAMS